MAQDFIYMVEVNNFYKIGVTQDIRSRLGALQNASPIDVQFLYLFKFDYAYKIERILHNHFKRQRRRGEWFEFTPTDICDFMNICFLLGGTPANLLAYQVLKPGYFQYRQNLGSSL
jgi:hypothetical protein